MFLSSSSSEVENSVSSDFVEESSNADSGSDSYNASSEEEEDDSEEEDEEEEDEEEDAKELAASAWAWIRNSGKKKRKRESRDQKMIAQIRQDYIDSITVSIGLSSRLNTCFVLECESGDISEALIYLGFTPLVYGDGKKANLPLAMARVLRDMGINFDFEPYIND